MGQAELNGPKQRGDWNVHINGGDQLFFATMHRGAFDYYYYNDHIGVVKPPLRNNFLDDRITLFAKGDNAAALGDFAGWRETLNFPEIRIFNPNRNSDEIYSTTVHELAHASHHRIYEGNFNQVDNDIVESWARAVQTAFTEWRFGPWYANYTWQNAYQDVTNVRETNYTPLFIDLMDNRNQNFERNWLLLDNVNGYAIWQLENELRDADHLQELRDHLRDRYDNPSEWALDEYFNQYF